jgi:hypothetical protein
MAWLAGGIAWEEFKNQDRSSLEEEVEDDGELLSHMTPATSGWLFP